MTEQDAFLKALAENEDDTPTRLIFADWLEERGEHEEADRHRKWPAAKEWLVRFCEQHNPTPDEDAYAQLWAISYQKLVELGRESVGEAKTDEGGFGFSCGENITMSESLNENRGEFWKNWSVVTGISLPPGIEERCYFRCAC